jgi:ribose transport system permease protein
VLTGLASVISDGVPVSGLDALHFMGTASYWRIPAPVFVVAAIFIVGTVFLTQTRGGVRLLAVGGNAEAVRRAGVNANIYRVLGFVLSGACAAIGGIVTAAVVTEASPNISTSVLFDALTAVALSGVPLTGGRGSLPRVLVGALVIASIASVLVIKNVPPYWTTVTTGALLVAALGVERVLSRAVATRVVTQKPTVTPATKAV